MRRVSTINLEPILEQAERRAVLTVLRAHPEWTLGHVFRHVESNGRRAPLLRNLTLGELVGELLTESPDLSRTDEPPIDPARLDAAQKLEGADFDEVLLSVIAEARGRRVAASYLKARVGGPRWKLQASVRRLIKAGVVERSGTTSGTRYRVRPT